MRTLRKIKNVVKWKNKQDDCQVLVKESIKLHQELELDSIETLNNTEVSKDGKFTRGNAEDETDDEVELDELIEKNDNKSKKQKRKEKRKRMRKRCWKMCRRTFKYLRIGFTQWANMTNFGFFPTDFRSYSNKERAYYN
ncbi:unnamed protein product [Dimorphilus gyrociliatus]|uniref:Uncharacterized protein n=1 Tax=Dimorphilus gyrociliatus TaxID=2664684 RepID=A0A7I8W219_9ANNE|nr:unnamed protein product [Dimorphilus gyrociliatus]